MRERRARRLTRGLVAAGVATFVALMSHLIAGGAAPSALGLAVPLLLATSTSVVLAQVRVRWVRLTLSVTLSQVLFHLLFSLGAAGGGGTTSATGHVHGPAAAMAPAADASGPAVHASGSMWLAHAGAVVVTVLVLRHGEVVLARLRQALRRAAGRLMRASALVVPVRAHEPAAPLQDDRGWLPVARVLTSASVVRRGPPAAVLAHP